MDKEEESARAWRHKFHWALKLAGAFLLPWVITWFAMGGPPGAAFGLPILLSLAAGGICVLTLPVSNNLRFFFLVLWAPFELMGTALVAALFALVNGKG